MNLTEYALLAVAIISVAVTGANNLGGANFSTTQSVLAALGGGGGGGSEPLDTSFGSGNYFGEGVGNLGTTDEDGNSNPFDDWSYDPQTNQGQKDPDCSGAGDVSGYEGTTGYNDWQSSCTYNP